MHLEQNTITLDKGPFNHRRKSIKFDLLDRPTAAGGWDDSTNPISSSGKEMLGSNVIDGSNSDWEVSDRGRSRGGDDLFRKITVGSGPLRCWGSIIHWGLRRNQFDKVEKSTVTGVEGVGSLRGPWGGNCGGALPAGAVLDGSEMLILVVPPVDEPRFDRQQAQMPRAVARISTTGTAIFKAAVVHGSCERKSTASTEVSLIFFLSFSCSYDRLCKSLRSISSNKEVLNEGACSTNLPRFFPFPNSVGCISNRFERMEQAGFSVMM